MNPGSRVDWGGNQSPVRGRSSGSFSALLGHNRAPKGRGVSPGAATRRGQSVVRNGGTVGQKTISGLSGLKKTLVDRRVNTASHKTTQVTSGGGHTSRANIQAKPSSVRVGPEN
jgi:hypothetical protein